MKITACLSFFDESPTWLAGHVASVARFCDHILAVDGAYAGFPQARPSSGKRNHEALLEVAEATGIGITLDVPSNVWEGNEVEKRDHMMRLGVHLSTEDDWLFVIDADEKVIESPPKASMLRRLEETPYDVAEVLLGMREDHYAWMAKSPAFAHLEAEREPILPAHGGPTLAAGAARRLFRARRDLRVEGAHYLYRVTGPSGDPVNLWGGFPNSAPAERLDGVLVEHRDRFRDPNRAARKKAWYELRDRHALECTAAELDAQAVPA